MGVCLQLRPLALAVQRGYLVRYYLTETAAVGGAVHGGYAVANRVGTQLAVAIVVANPFIRLAGAAVDDSHKVRSYDDGVLARRQTFFAYYLLFYDLHD